MLELIGPIELVGGMFGCACKPSLYSIFQQNMNHQINKINIEIHSAEEFPKVVVSLLGFPVQDKSKVTLEIAGLKVCLDVLFNHPEIFSFEYPIKITGSESPDFKMVLPNSEFGIEITEAVDEERRRQIDMSERKIKAGQLNYPYNVPGTRRDVNRISPKELDEHQADGIIRGEPTIGAGDKEDCKIFVSGIENIIKSKEEKNYNGNNILVILVEEIVGSTVHRSKPNWLQNPLLKEEFEKLHIDDFEFQQVILFFMDQGYIII